MNSKELKDLLDANKSARDAVKAIMDTRDPIEEYGKDPWDIENHKVMDPGYLPDKITKNKEGETTGIKYVNRITQPYQKLIVNNSVAFGFANEVTIQNNAENTQASALLAEIEQVLHDSKENSLNQDIAKSVYRFSEAAEMWYFRPKDGDYVIRPTIFSRGKKDSLYPIFDEYEDMTAFARLFSTRKNEVRMTVWTAEKRYELTKEEATDWRYSEIKDNPIRKIPVIYSRQDSPEWVDVQPNIERLELLLSRHAEINDYHAAPKTFVRGTLTSAPKAGEAGGIIAGGENTDVKILSWDSASDSVKLEIDNLLNAIHKFTQTPDISFENIKGLNQASGVMLKMLFMDAHLKVARKAAEIWDAHFTRRYNILKAMVNFNATGQFDSAVQELNLSPVFTPFMIDDLETMVGVLMAANGGQQIIAHQHSIELLGIAKDTKKEYETIKLEEEERFDRRMAEPFGII